MRLLVTARRPRPRPSAPREADLRRGALRALRERGALAAQVNPGSDAASRPACVLRDSCAPADVATRTPAPPAPQRKGGPRRIVFLALGVLVGAALRSPCWASSAGSSGSRPPRPTLEHAQAHRPGRELGRLRRRRHAPRLHPVRHAAHAGRPRRSRRRAATRPSRSRTGASTSTRASTSRASSAPRSRTSSPARRAGRLDADDAADPQPLHRATAASATLQAQDPRGQARRGARERAPGRGQALDPRRSTSTTCPTAPSAARPRSASRPRRASSSTSPPRS